MKSMKRCIIMDASDNVATVLESVCQSDGLTVVDRALRPCGSVTAREEIPFAHKICLAPIKAGGDVVKFGVVIGRATADIGRGEYVHIHNVVSIEGSEKITAGGQRLC